MACSNYARKKTTPHYWSPVCLNEPPLTSQECSFIDYSIEEINELEKSEKQQTDRELLIQYHILVRRLYARRNANPEMYTTNTKAHPNNNICASCHLFCGLTPKCQTCGAQTCYLCRKSYDNAPNIKRCPVCYTKCYLCNQVYSKDLNESSYIQHKNKCLMSDV